MNDSPSPRAPASDRLERILALGEEMRTAEADVARLALESQAAADRLREIVERRLPEAMDEAGLAEFRLRDGRSVVVEPAIQVKQPPVHQRGAAYAWLEDHGQGGLVKRSVEVAVGPGQQERAHALADRLGVDFPGAVREAAEVHTGQLKAYIRRAVENGEAIPLELFGARVFRVAKVTD